MKSTITFLVLLLFWFAQPIQSQDFITEWTFTSAQTTLQFSVLTVGTVNYTWSASPSGNSGSGSFAANGPIGLSNFDFEAGDIVTLNMNPTNLRRFYIDNGTDRLSLTNIIQWGAVPWSSMDKAFFGCENLQITASDVPNLSGVGTMSAMFRNCSTLNGPANINSWNTASVTNMSRTFQGASAFNQDISSWNTASVFNMSSLFEQASAFNQNIGNWNTTSVTNMSSMFKFATSFNEDISNWNLSNVITLSGMFWGASVFNNDIGGWDVSSVTNMSEMFFGASAFGQNIENWNVSNVLNMSGMFSIATSFNQFIGNWNVSNVTNMSFMFFGNSIYNQNLGSWDVSSVTTMEAMFNNDLNFNQDISSWNVSNVTNMRTMFRNAIRFNQDIGSWNVSNVNNMGEMFSGARDFNQNIENWDVSNVSALNNMFLNAEDFNQNLGLWTLRSNVSLFNMLNGSGMDCDNYSATLVGLVANNPTIINRSLGALGRTYGTSAVAARNTLVNDRGWTISGDVAGGDACDALLSTIDIEFANQVTLHPNPSSNEFTIKLNRFYENVKVEIYNVNGQVVLNKTYQNVHEIRLNIDNESGIYFLKVNSDNQSSTHKLIRI